MFMRRLWLGASAGALILATLVDIPQADAGAFQIRSHSARGFGMAVAGVAAGDQLSYSFWNPAALSAVEGIEVEGVVSGIFPSIELSPDATTNAIVGGAGGTPTSNVDIGTNALVPASFAAMRINDRLTAGLSVTSAFGLATEAPHNWAGQIYARDSEILSFNVNPMLAFQVNEILSLGAGVQVQYFEADLTQAAGLAPGVPSAELSADGVGVGFNLGVQLRPWEGTTFGLGFRSAISHDLEGDFTLAGAATPARTTLETPETISFGVEQVLTPRARLMGTVEWTNWSRIGTVPVYASAGPLITTLPLRYRDGWLFSVGGEYDATDRVTVRGGLGYEIAPMDDVSRDVRLPETDQLIMSAGMSYAYSERISFDLGLTYSIGLGDGPVTIVPGDPRFLGVPFQASSDLDVAIVSAGMSMKFGGTAAPGVFKP